MRRGIVALALSATIGVSVAAAQLRGARPSVTASFPSQIVLGMQTRGGGDYNFSTVTLPTSVSALQVSLDISEATSPLPLWTTSLEGSVDGGNSWTSAGSFNRSAGPKPLNRQGQPETILVATFAGGPFWQDTANPQRRLRGKATLGGTMRFALTILPL